MISKSVDNQEADNCFQEGNNTSTRQWIIQVLHSRGKQETIPKARRSTSTNDTFDTSITIGSNAFNQGPL